MDSEPTAIQPAATDVTLEEMSPCYGWRSYWGNVFLTELVLLLFPGALILVATWPRFSEALPGLTCTILLALPVACLCAWSQNGYLRSRSATVTYAKGMLSTIAGTNMYSASLDQCRWYYGNSTRATVPSLEGLPVAGGGRALLIESPHECQTEGTDVVSGALVSTGPVIVAVGFDEAGREAWEELLQGASAAYDAEREAIPSPLSGLAALVLVLLAIPLCVIGTVWGSAVIARTLVGLGVAKSVAQAVTVPLFLPGIIYVLLYVFLLFLLYKRRSCVTEKQRQATMEPLRPHKSWFLMALAFCTIPQLLHIVEDPIANTLQIVVALLLTGLVAWHFRVLVKDPENEASE